MIRKLTSGILTFVAVASVVSFTLPIHAFASEAAVTSEKAITIAIEDAKFDKAQDAKAELVTENGAEVYKVTFYVGKAAVTYRIDAASGTVLGRTMNNAPVAN